MDTTEKIDLARKTYLEGAGGQLDGWLKEWCESPIEQLLLATLLNNGWHLPEFHEQVAAIRWMKQQRVDAKARYLSGSRFIDCFLFFQAETSVEEKDYRLDMALATPGAKYVFELDGHDFHERTKEQASSDKARDRAFTLTGWKVLRYTGSDVHGDPEAIVKTINDLCRSATEDEWEERKLMSCAAESEASPHAHLPAPMRRGGPVRRYVLTLRRFVGPIVAIVGAWEHVVSLIVVGLIVAAFDQSGWGRR